MRGDPNGAWYDGVSYVTQCPIPYGHTMTYRFLVCTPNLHSFFFSFSHIFSISYFFFSFSYTHARTRARTHTHTHTHTHTGRYAGEKGGGAWTEAFSPAGCLLLWRHLHGVCPTGDLLKRWESSCTRDDVLRGPGDSGRWMRHRARTGGTATPHWTGWTACSGP
jgi:Multicopper oxidase